MNNFARGTPRNRLTTRYRTPALAISVLCFWLMNCAPLAWADGMIPETSVVIVDEARGEASIKVTNSDSIAALLHVSLEHIPEDQVPRVFVTPPVSRVEPGQTQLVRFILDTEQPLLTQRLKRVIFEGIEQQTAKGGAVIGINVRQNLPVILHPKGLARNGEPWLGLEWALEDGHLRVRNPTPYVVRLAQELRLKPSKTGLLLPRTYVLPGDDLRLKVPASVALADTHVRLQPATVYGFAVDALDAPLLDTPR